MTRGAVGPYLLYPAILEDLNLLKDLEVGNNFCECYVHTALGNGIIV